MELTRDGKEIVFVCVPDHASISGYSAADSAPKAYLRDISDEFFPFSDLESRVNKVCWSFGDRCETGILTTSCLKLLFFPTLNDCISCPLKNRREETIICGLRVGHS